MKNKIARIWEVFLCDADPVNAETCENLSLCFIFDTIVYNMGCLLYLYILDNQFKYWKLLENINIISFNLSEREMYEISGINKNYRVRFDPDSCDYSKL